MNKNLLIAAILAILVVISAVQAFQLNDLKQKVESGSIGKAAVPAAIQSGGAASGINDLPSMIGGC